MKLEKDRGIEIMICDETGPGPCSKPIGGKSVRITENSAYNFSYGNFDYVIKLDRIGRAGKNVFNPAAYITFEKYQKK